MARPSQRAVLCILFVLIFSAIAYVSYITNFKIIPVWTSPKPTDKNTLSDKRMQIRPSLGKDESQVKVTSRPMNVSFVSVSSSHTSRVTTRNPASWRTLLHPSTARNPDLGKTLLHPSIARNPAFGSSLLHPSIARNSTVLTRTATSWKNEDGVCNLETGGFVKTTLRSPAGNTPIYVYSVTVDQWVSGSIINQGIWERGGVQTMYDLMKIHPDADFVDLGANLGVYGLTLAKMGRRVILIDPLLSNVKRLCKSVREGHFSNEVYVIHNAMSDKRYPVGFGTYKGNVGGTYVKEVTPSGTEVTSPDTEIAQAVFLDDLLEMFNFKKVIMKIDVETHETRALLGGERFFSTVDVIIVQLEWNAHKKDGGDIIRFLTKHNMKPYHPTTQGAALDLNSFDKWPGDILWKKE